MKFKIIIINFWNKTKQSKKEIIIWAIITFLITSTLSHYVLEHLFSYIDDIFSPKPNILSNIVIFKNSNITECCSNMQNFYFLYYLGTDWATLYFLNASDKEKIDRYGNVVWNSFFDFNNCPECSYYSFTLKNIGNKKADKILIDIRSSVTPELFMDSPKMTRKDCGGYFESKGCYLIFENIEREEEINFVLMIKEYSDLNIMSCVADEKYDCEFRFIKVLAQTIDPNRDVLIMNNKKVIFPTMKNSEPNTLYYFDPNQFDETKTVWVTISSTTDIGK